MEPVNVVDRETWLEARRDLMRVEKSVMRQVDEVAALRRELPWVLVDEPYEFDTHDGRRSLADLFGGCSQLIVYHFMLGPGWVDGCPSCSFWADGYDGMVPHLAARDTRLFAVSRAPLDEIDAYRERMGWSFEWVSSAPSSFNVDYDVSFPDGAREGAMYNFAPVEDPGEELPGLSVFVKADDGNVYHTYSAYARGLDPFNNAYQMLDTTPKGRDEADLPWSMAWLRRHDEYS